MRRDDYRPLPGLKETAESKSGGCVGGSVLVALREVLRSERAGQVEGVLRPAYLVRRADRDAA